MKYFWQFPVLVLLCVVPGATSAQLSPPAAEDAGAPRDQDASSDPSPAAEDAGAPRDQDASSDPSPAAEDARAPRDQDAASQPEPGAPTQEAPTQAAPAQAAPAQAAPTQAAPMGQAPAAPMGQAVDVVVTRKAANAADRLRRSSAAVQVIDLDRLRGEGAELGAVLSRHAGLNVRSTGGLGSQARISVQGLGADQIRFFVDGAPLEFSGYPESIANVPVDLAARVDVYRGVVPAVFGADALGGAINLVGHDLEPGPHASASYQLASFDSHRAALRLQTLSERTGVFARAQGFLDSARNNYPIQVEEADASGRNVTQTVHRFHDAYSGGFGSLEVGVVDRPYARRLSLRGFASSYDKEINHNVVMTSAYGEVLTKRRAQGASVRYEHDFGKHVSLNLTLGYAHRKNALRDLGECDYDWFGQCGAALFGSGEIGRGATNRRLNEQAGFVRAQLGLRASRVLQFRLSASPTLASRSGHDLALVPGQNDPLAGRRDLFNLTLAAEHELDAFRGRLENVLFAKHYLLVARAEERVVSGDLVAVDRDLQRGGAGDALRLRLSDTLIAKASYELTTRLPSADEVFGDGMLIASNLRLKPERSHNANLELTLALPSARAGEFSGTLGGFARLSDDLIVLLADDRTFGYYNVLSARAFGFESAVRYTAPRDYVALDANLTWQDMRNRSTRGPFAKSEGDRVPNRPYLFANWSIRLQLPELFSEHDSLSLTFRQHYVHGFFRSWEGTGDVEGKEKIPAQLVSSALLGYAISQDRRSLLASFEVHNLTDIQVFDFYGVQRPGRWVLAKLSLSI
jgi:outer membrane cobalamin receptor